jgi:arabinofuranosyltransferase
MKPKRRGDAASRGRDRRDAPPKTDARRNDSVRRSAPELSGPSGPGPSFVTTWSGLPPVHRVLIGLGLAVSLALLMAHALSYRFLTDDAYISFRYARNLSQGFGLVFNPGHEPVEGYSNFLFVLVLALFATLGLAPPVMAHVLTLSATVVLWGLIAWFGLRSARDARAAWTVVAVLIVLATIRSVAVWSTSGLETRWFETLLVGGALRLVVEVEGELRGRPRRNVSVWLLALAAWTRPDGLLLAVSAFGISAWFLYTRGRLDVARFAMRLAPFAFLVGGHFLWRRAYYGYWLPNTYYAKVGGKLWWDSGFSYLAAFVLEYALYLWVPLLVAAWLHHRRHQTTFVPLLFAALSGPHVLYIAAIGGDHFEYRPLDLYFPLLLLLMADGARHVLETRTRWVPALVPGLALILVGVWELPHQSHVQFPRRYLPGFPGCQFDLVEARDFLDPSLSPVYRWPLLRGIAQAHRDRIWYLSSHFAGLRQEEHRMFLATVEPDGKILRKAIDRGIVPRDTYVAMSCVGAIPYYSDLRTLDILGLTDAHVAHSTSTEPHRAMAHDKQASLEYAQSRGVELWAVEGVHLICHVTSSCLLSAVRTALTSPDKYLPYFGAPIGDGYDLIAYLLQGESRTQLRMPHLELTPVGNREFVERFLTEGIAAYRERLARDPKDDQSRLEMAYLLMINKDFAAAEHEYEQLVRAIRGTRTCGRTGRRAARSSAISTAHGRR